MRLNSHVKNALYLGLFVALADQLSKWWLVNHIMHPPRIVEVTPFLNLVLVHNRGITFGMLNMLDRENAMIQHYMPYILMGVAAAILFLLGRWVWLTHSRVVALGLGAIMGGAVGNLLDRIREGAVVDFLDFHYYDYHWYAFNIADAAIVTGVSLLVLDSILRAR